MNFDKIVIHFENCETAVIPQKDIISITLKGITRNYSFQNEKHSLLNGSNEYETADYIDIILAPTANDIENMQLLFDDIMSPFERIKTHDDIVAIDFHKDSKRIRTIGTLWHASCVYSNEFQKSSELGDTLRITIGV